MRLECEFESFFFFFPQKISRKIFLLSVLGIDYMIPFCEDEISIRSARTDFTLQLHGEINF